MPLPVDLEPLSNDLLGNVEVTDDDCFIMDPSQSISSGDLLNTVQYFITEIRPKFHKYYRYYKGHHDILDRKKKPLYKPDNRIVINFPRKAVNDFNGFYAGNPIQITSPDSSVNEFNSNWENVNNFDDIVLESSKQSSIYGRSFIYAYQDSDMQTCITVSNPMDTFMIYDNTVAQNKLYAVQFYTDINSKLHITLTDKNYMREFVDDTSSNAYLTNTSSYVNPFPDVPLFEYMENSERMPLCYDLYTVFDKIDDAISSSANDVDYYGDAYLKLINVGLNDKNKVKFFQYLKDHRMINVPNVKKGQNIDIGFLQKPNADSTSEHLISHLVNAVYQIAGIVNPNDKTFSGNPSGVALKLKFNSMKDMARMKSLKFKSTLRDMFSCVYGISSNDVASDAWKQLDFKFNQDIPVNMVEEAQFASVFWDKLPREKFYSLFPWITDPHQVNEQFMQEQSQNMNTTSNMLQNSNKSNNNATGSN